MFNFNFHAYSNVFVHFYCIWWYVIKLVFSIINHLTCMAIKGYCLKKIVNAFMSQCIYKSNIYFTFVRCCCLFQIAWQIGSIYIYEIYNNSNCSVVMKTAYIYELKTFIICILDNINNATYTYDFRKL